MTIRQGDTIVAGSIKADDYTALVNKPKINNIELVGNKSLEDLGIQPAGQYVTTTILNTTLENYATLDNTYTKAEVDDKIAKKSSLPEQNENTYGLFLQSGNPEAKWAPMGIIRTWEE